MMTEQQVVVIGGSEGIGLAVAKAARTLGARVLAVSRTKEKLEAARDAVSGLEIRVADINNTASIQCPGLRYFLPRAGWSGKALGG